MANKMRIVNEAVGMGALDPNADPRAIRRASQAAPEVQDKSGEKLMLFGGIGVAALAIIGAVIYLVKEPSAEEKNRAAMKKNAAIAAKTEKEEAAKAGLTSDKPKTPVDTGWDINEAIEADVLQTIAALKGKTADEAFAKTAMKLLRHGRNMIPPLVESWHKLDQESAEVSRQIVVAATGRGVPEEYFYEKLKRLDMAMAFRQWWLTDAGQAAQLKSESEFSQRLCGKAVVGDTPPVNPGGNPPVNPGGTGNGVTEVKKPSGGVGEAAMRRDLPQHLSNYARGTFEQRETAVAEIRRYGKQVIPALIGALKEEDIAMANAANDLLKTFTKQDQGRVPGEPIDRPPFIQKWTEWWKGAEAGFAM